jgi:hypothetical protein
LPAAARRPAVPWVCAASRAAAEPALALRCAAAHWAWRLSAPVEAAACPSRLSAEKAACARLRDRGFALRGTVCDTAARDALPTRAFCCAGGSFTAEHRAFGSMGGLPLYWRLPWTTCAEN